MRHCQSRCHRSRRGALPRRLLWGDISAPMQVVPQRPLICNRSGYSGEREKPKQPGCRREAVERTAKTRLEIFRRCREPKGRREAAEVSVGHLCDVGADFFPSQGSEREDYTLHSSARLVGELAVGERESPTLLSLACMASAPRRHGTAAHASSACFVDPLDVASTAVRPTAPAAMFTHPAPMAYTSIPPTDDTPCA